MIPSQTTEQTAEKLFWQHPDDETIQVASMEEVSAADVIQRFAKALQAKDETNQKLQEQLGVAKAALEEVDKQFGGLLVRSYSAQEQTWNKTTLRKITPLGEALEKLKIGTSR